MTLQHLDAVIAFAAVMLGVSLVITAATQIALSVLGLRGANLRRSLVDLLETACTDREAKRHAKAIARRVLRHPLISDSVFSRFRVQLYKLPFVSEDAAAKLQWAANGIPFRPWLLGALVGFFALPIALIIADHLFPVDVCRYSDLLASYVPALNLCKNPWSSGAILGAVFAGLLSRWRLATWIRYDELVASLEKLSEPPSNTLPDAGQCAMLVIAGAARNEASLRAKPVSARMERLLVQEPPDSGDGGVAVAIERPITQVSAPAPAETSAEGLRTWFDRAMDRASQRFTLQARVITVVLSLVLVLAAHLDAIRLFQTLSSDAELRTQLASSAAALTKLAEQAPRIREGAVFPARSARGAVPDVYRKAMAAVLQPVTTVTEQPKAKPRPASRSAAPAAASSSEPSPNGGPAMPDDAPDSLSDLFAALGGEQRAPSAVQAASETPARKEETHAARPQKSKLPAKEKEKPAATAPPAPKKEDKFAEAKARAAKALQDAPGFASREDAVLWLRATLDGDAAVENLVAAYEQEVNAELVTDADKLIDHSASLKRELARSQLRLLPEKWPGWTPGKHELPGLLVTVAFLSLGAPFWYNVLKKLTSLRPLPALKQEQEQKQDKPA